MVQNEFHFYDKGQMQDEFLIWKCQGSVIQRSDKSKGFVILLPEVSWKKYNPPI